MPPEGDCETRWRRVYRHEYALGLLVVVHAGQWPMGGAYYQVTLPTPGYPWYGLNPGYHTTLGAEYGGGGPAAYARFLQRIEALRALVAQETGHLPPGIDILLNN